MSITYEIASDTLIIVYLDRKRVGCIHKVDSGFQFKARGSIVFGDVFRTLKECKQSLEEE